MARDKGLPEDIFDAIVARLVDQIPEVCTEANTYQAINPDAVGNNPGDLIFVVAPLSGNAPEEYQVGGGEEQLTIFGGFLVKIHSPLQMDQFPQDVHLLKEKTHGLWKIARKVLVSLVNWDPQKGDDELLRDPIKFLGFALGKGPRKKRSLGSIELHFNLNFDWDITTPESDLSQ